MPQEKYDQVVTDLAAWLKVSEAAIRKTPVPVIAALRPMLERDQRYEAYKQVADLEAQAKELAEEERLAQYVAPQ